MTTRAFRIDVAWAEQVPPLRDDGLHATFAHLTIRCGDEVVTRHVHGASVFDSVYVPLAPLATWLAASWADLLGGSPPFGLADGSDAHRAIARIDDDTWEAREDDLDGWLHSHGLRFVGDGVYLPDLILWRIGDHISMSWRPSRAAPTVEFLGEGHLEIPVRDFVDEARRFLRSVVERIEGADERSASRHEVRRAWTRFSAPWGASGLRLVAARLGRRFDDVHGWLAPLAEDERRRLVAKEYGADADAAFDPAFLDSPVAMAARSGGPRFTPADHARVVALGATLAAAPKAKGLADLRAVLRASPAAAFPRAKDGYRRATDVRAVLKRPTDPLDVETLLRRRGCVLVDATLDDVGTDGLVLWSHDGRALVVANVASPRTATPWGRRATLAHELYHLLFDVGDGRFFGEATAEGVPTPSEPAANAFAAELLLPARCLPTDVSGYWTNPTKARTAIEDLCDAYQVGWELAVRQLQNHRRLPAPLVEALLQPSR